MKIELLASRVESQAYLERALGMKMASDAVWLPTYCAFILRRLVGVLEPCTRRELLSQARRALVGLAGDELDALITGGLEDLLVGGDVMELPALVARRDNDAPMLLFGAPPAFIAEDRRVRILGVAADDARFLPEGVQSRVIARGGDRFIEADDMPAMMNLLKDLGLRELDGARWLGRGTDEPAVAFLRRVRERLTLGGRAEALADMQWLWPSDGHAQNYRARWQSKPPPDVDLAIARAPQQHGNPRWYVVDPTNLEKPRIADLPMESEISVRGCDMAWSVQLALDAERGNPAHYHVLATQDGWTSLRLEFPLPLHHRRRLLHLGGRRTTEDQGFRFHVPSADLATAEAILSAAWMSPAKSK